MEAQALSVKRAEVEFHKFAAMGEPERAIAAYAWENAQRRALIHRHAQFIGPVSPFLEIGANVGHTSYMLSNDFGADGFALDISADALRYGAVLRKEWRLSRSPVRVAGDALRLPFRDGSMRLVMTFQTLSQFTDIESVVLEAKRVLAPGGVFLFAEEPLRRLLTLRLFRCPYPETMSSWERRLHGWGLLGYLVRDVIGAQQEDSYGIRQNHSMSVKDWGRLLRKHFVEQSYEVLVPAEGWGEQVVRKLAVRLDPYRSLWRAALLLGGTLAAVCRKGGEAPPLSPAIDRFEKLLCCPDCRGTLDRDAINTLRCGCGYQAPLEDGVYNLLPSAVRSELYPGDREDIIDFTRPGHENRLLEGWGELEGVFGNKYRWIGPYASVLLTRVEPGPQRIRIRGYVHERSLRQEGRIRMSIHANGDMVRQWKLRRPGLFVLEADLPYAEEYKIEIRAFPVWQAPPDDRLFTVNISLLRLAPKD